MEVFFIYAMFDEDLKLEGVEQHFGLFHTDNKLVYHLVFPNASNIVWVHQCMADMHGKLGDLHC
jgi:hypothetical protein